MYPIQVNSNLDSEEVKVLDSVLVLYSSHWAVLIILEVLPRDHLLRDRERVLLVPDFLLANYMENLILASVQSSRELVFAITMAKKDI